MILRTLLSHYKKHPVQLLFLLAGIAMANVLLTGTLLINAQARASYEQGEQLLQSGPTARIQSQDPQRPLDERDYVQLRRAGFDMLAPVLRKTVRSDGGQVLEILGIDLFALGGARSAGGELNTEQQSGDTFAAFSFEPWQLWLAAGRLEQLGWTEGERYPLESGALLPPVSTVKDSQLGHRLLVDIKALQTLTESDHQLSWISVSPSTEQRLQALRKTLPKHLEYVSAADSPNAAELTRSFHLNLAAMGLLAFVVGIFLTYNALAFSYTDRRNLIRRMRLAGVEQDALRRGLILELMIFLGAGSLLGCWLGAKLAAWLLPGVGQTLAQLYGVYIAYPDSLAPMGFLLPVAMTVLAAFLCVLIPLRDVMNAPLLEKWQLHWQYHSLAQRDRLLSLLGLGFLAVSGLVALLRPGLWPTLAGMASLLLGTALLLPLALSLVLKFLQGLVSPSNPRTAWLLADSRWLLGPAALALMALTLALVANSGLNTMIGSFRQATDQWLDQRLAADLFLRADRDPSQVRDVLEQSFPQLELSERYRNTLSVDRPQGGVTRVEVISLQQGGRYRDSIELLDRVDDARPRFESGSGIYVSERAFRLDGWQPGDPVALCERHPEIDVLGVYHDYGNPESQWLLSQDLFRSCWPSLAPISLAVSGSPDTPWSAVRKTLLEQLDLQADAIIDQAELKAVGMSVFDRTFTVTQALNGLTLLVAAIGIFCAISAIHHHRIGQQALLASLGVSRMERGILLLAQWGLLGLLCLLLVWPFGILLAGYLASVVTPTAFGWSFPLVFHPGQFLQLAAWAIASLFLAIVLPSARLLRASPAVLLKEESA